MKSLLGCAFLVSLVLIATGCQSKGSTRGSGLLRDEGVEEISKPTCLSSGAQGRTCTTQDALDYMVATGTFCRNVHNYYERNGFRTNTARFGIATLGALAGNVFAVTSGGDGAKAWAGLSGTVNGIQASLNESFSVSLTQAKQREVRKAYIEGVALVLAEQDPTKRINILVATQVMCSMAGANAEAKVAEALAEATSGTGVSDLAKAMGVEAASVDAKDEAEAAADDAELKSR